MEGYGLEFFKIEFGVIVVIGLVHKKISVVGINFGWGSIDTQYSVGSVVSSPRKCVL